jgi:hypothetical protein
VWLLQINGRSSGGPHGQEVTMSTARSINSPAIVFALICALALSAIGGAVSAQANEDTATAAALAQERYYSSYGEPEPLTLPQTGAPSDDTPWLPIALSIAIAAALVAGGATQVHRLRDRARVAAEER